MTTNPLDDGTELPYKHVTDPNCADPSLLWAEIAYLREAVKGLPGYSSQQKAAVAERHKRVQLEQALQQALAGNPGTDLDWDEAVSQAARARAETYNQADQEEVYSDVFNAFAAGAHWQRARAKPNKPVLSAANGGDWREPTTINQRLGDVLQLLCGGQRPPEDMIVDWQDSDKDDTLLQYFCATHGPAWAQGIGLIDLAMVAVNQPTEGPDHEYASTSNATSSSNERAGWLEATIAWEVCASLHRKFCKGKDALFSTRQADYVRHAEDARKKAQERPDAEH